MKFCRRELSSENTQCFLCKEGETEEGKQILVLAEENKERLDVKYVIQTDSGVKKEKKWQVLDHL